MKAQPIKIQLFPKNDTDGQVYYIGKLHAPININFGEGIEYFVYLENGIQELHICTSSSFRIYNPELYYTVARKKKSRSRHTNISVDLYKEVLEDGLKYYHGSITGNCFANAAKNGGVVFLVFVADESEEELQISIPK